MELIKKLENKSGHELAKEILENISNRVGIDLYALLTTDETPTPESILDFKKHIVQDAVLQFRKNTKDNNEEDFGVDDLDDDALVNMALSPDAEPNWMINPEVLAIIKSYTGEAVLTYLKTLTKRFEQITTSTSPGMVAVTLLSGGLVALGAQAGYGAWVNRALGMRAAAIAGVRSVGMATVVSIAAVTLAMFILWLIFDNQKNVLGLVINESDNDLIVRNYGMITQEIYMESGSMKNFMIDQESLGSPKVQIKGGYTDPDDPAESFHFGGIYFADKKVGFYGAEGVFVLTPRKGGERIAIMFASPYHADNGTNMKILNPSETELKKVYKDLYGSRKVNYSHRSGRISLQSHINSNRGGNVGNIAVIKFDN